MINMPNRKTPARVAPALGKSRHIHVVGGGLCLGAASLVAAMLLASCAASISSVLQADGGARIEVQATLIAPVAAKFRRLAAAGSASGAASSALDAPIFDKAAIRKSIASRPYLSLAELSSPDHDSIRLVVNARSLQELADAPDLKGSGLIAVSRGPGWTECRFHLERDNAKNLSLLFPGIDAALLDALSPPALDEDPVTTDDYRTMLKSLLGEKAMPALEDESVALAITAPSKVLNSGGGSLSGSTLRVKIPLFQALVLEKPIDFWIRWI